MEYARRPDVQDRFLPPLPVRTGCNVRRCLGHRTDGFDDSIGIGSVNHVDVHRSTGQGHLDSGSQAVTGRHLPREPITLPAPGSQGALADEAGDDITLEASGNDGSDAGEDAGLAAIGVGARIAVDAAGADDPTSLLLQPKSAIAHRSAQRVGLRFIDVPFVER